MLYRIMLESFYCFRHKNISLFLPRPRHHPQLFSYLFDKVLVFLRLVGRSFFRQFVLNQYYYFLRRFDSGIRIAGIICFGWNGSGQTIRISG